MINISKDVHQPGTTVFVRMNNSAVHKCQITCVTIRIYQAPQKVSAHMMETVMYSVQLSPDNNDRERVVDIRADQVFLKPEDAFV